LGGTSVCTKNNCGAEPSFKRIPGFGRGECKRSRDWGGPLFKKRALNVLTYGFAGVKRNGGRLGKL